MSYLIRRWRVLHRLRHRINYILVRWGQCYKTCWFPVPHFNSCPPSTTTYVSGLHSETSRLKINKLKKKRYIYAKSSQRSSLQQGHTNISAAEAANDVAEEWAAKDRKNFSSWTSLPKATCCCSWRFLHSFLILKFEIGLIWPLLHIRALCMYVIIFFYSLAPFPSPKLVATNPGTYHRAVISFLE